MPHIFNAHIFFFFLIFPYAFLRRQIFLFTYGSFKHLVGFLGRGISPAPRPVPTQDNTTQRNTDTVHALSRIRNCEPTQCPSGRRQYLP
jgi:hypothetical protein